MKVFLDKLFLAAQYTCLVFLLCFIWVLPKAMGQSKVTLHTAVEIGGIQQWVGAVGKDQGWPLLLFLHGGPGFSSRNYSKKFIKYLQDDFIVAQWDQRETGITAHWGPYQDSLTLDLFYQDTEEVIAYLLNKYSKNKLYLVGFSWGGLLGFNYAQKHPENIHAYVAVSSMVHNKASELLTRDWLIERAQSENNREALEALETTIFPYQSWEGLYQQRKWMHQLLLQGTSKKEYPKNCFNLGQKNGWLCI